MPEEVTKFGPKQIGNPTPQWATNVFRIALYTAGVTTIIIGTFTSIPPTIKAEIMQYCVEGVIAIHAISKLFGITIQNDPTSQN